MLLLPLLALLLPVQAAPAPKGDVSPSPAS